MKRRNFLGYTGLGALGVATSTVISGCSEEEPTVKFWQQGNFRPVSEEVIETNLKVEGSIPPELSGLYVRNGTNSSSGISDHFFGGDGMIHGVRLEAGQAKWYRNRMSIHLSIEKRQGVLVRPSRRIPPVRFH